MAQVTSTATPAAGDAQPQLLRVLGLWETTSIVMGIMIGTAIFIVPAEITRAMGSESAAMWVWVLSGLLSLFGALSFAELAGIMPQAGGQYVYLREAYGPLISFLCGWAFFLAVESGGISVLAVGFTTYLANLVPLTPWEMRLAAGGSIALFTAINYRGVHEGGLVQSILTGLKVGAMVALIALGYLLVHGPPAGPTTVPLPGGTKFVSSFGVAMVAALWAYEGWNCCTFAAGEVKRPERTVPLALMLGTITVILLYMGMTMVYYHILTVPEIAHTPRVAADAATRIFGRSGSTLVSIAVIVSTLGSLNGSILAAPRVYYAMAKDGLFFRWCGKVHPRYRTPHFSLLFQCAWSILLVAAGTYDQLYTYVIFAGWVFYALTGVAVIVLRRKMPGVRRPYKVVGYPLVPLLFGITCTWFLINMLVETPREASIGFLMMLVGIPVFWFWRRKAAPAAP
jgi:basic amino acid/polyamine antiporter, APA family